MRRAEQLEDRTLLTYIVVRDTLVDEGDVATFEVRAAEAVTTPLTVSWFAYSPAASNAATYGIDYCATSCAGAVTIAAGQATASINVGTIQDSLIEDDEIFHVDILDPSYGTIARSTGVATLMDDDAIEISVADSSVREGDSARVRVNLNQTATQDITVDWVADSNVSPPVATLAVDYCDGIINPCDSSITIPAGKTWAEIVVPTVEDQLIEDDERFRVLISNASLGTITDDSAVVTILDDDDVTLSVADASVEEGESARVVVSLNQSADFDISFDWLGHSNFSAPNLATHAVDYCSGVIDPCSGTATIPKGRTSVVLSVPTDEDFLLEGDEVFRVSVSNPTYGTVKDPDGTVTIEDDDDVEISVTDGSTMEGDSATVDIRLNKPAEQVVSVDWVAHSNFTGINKATYGVDYCTDTFIPCSGTVSIPVGQMSASVTVPTTHDTELEPNEKFRISIDNASYGAIVDDFGEITIVDNDDIQITVSDTDVTEGDYALIDINVSPATSQSITVQWEAHSNFPATHVATKTVDYCGGTWFMDPCSGFAVIHPWTTKTTVSVPTDDDTAVEEDEVFWFEIWNADYGTITDSVGVVTIIDDDGNSGPQEPYINIGDVTVFEDAGLAVLNLTLSEATSQAVTVTYETVNVTAMYPDDYEYETGQVTFPPMQTTATVDIVIHDDTLQEPTELFHVDLSNPQNAVLGDASGTVAIIDNDDALPEITIEDATVDEDAGSVSLLVELSQPHDETVSVDWATLDTGSASDPADYVGDTGTLTFPAGVTQQFVVVTIQDDVVEEPDETFEVNLSNAVEATITDGTGVVTIVDNDGDPDITISDVTVPEDQGPAELTVTLSWAHDVAVNVDFETHDGTAIAGLDYTQATGTITFAVGETERTISVPIINDSELEQDETFTVTLFNATNGVIVDGTGVVTIDDDEELVISIDTAVTVAEGVAAAPTVTLSPGPVSWPVTVNYVTTDGTATDPHDYNGANSSFVIPANTPSMAVPSIPTVLDTITDDGETFTVTISSDEATVQAGSDLSTVTITDVENFPPPPPPPGVPDGPAIIDPFRLENDTGVADGVTSDPTVEGMVLVNGTALAATDVEIDWNRDGVADGSATTDGQGWFEYDPSTDTGFGEGPVVVRARAQNGDDVWGDWYSVSFVYALGATFGSGRILQDYFSVGIPEGLTDWEFEVPNLDPGGGSTFSIIAGNALASDMVGDWLFEIDSDGVISAKRDLDYEHQYRYELTVKAAGPGSHEDTATVVVNVHDVASAGSPILEALPATTASSSITVTWNDTHNADSYKVSLIDPAGGETSNTTSGTSYTLTGMVSEGIHSVRVQAFNEIGEEGEWSLLNSFTYDTTPNPVVPTLTGPGYFPPSGDVTFTWDAIPDASEYILWYQKDGAPPSTQSGITGTSTTVTLDPGTYTARLKAINATGESWTGSFPDHQTNEFDWSEGIRFYSGASPEPVIVDAGVYSGNADSGGTTAFATTRSGHVDGAFSIDDLTGRITLDPLALLIDATDSPLQQALQGWFPSVHWHTNNAVAVDVALPWGSSDKVTVTVNESGGAFTASNTYPTPSYTAGSVVRVAASMPVAQPTGLYGLDVEVEEEYTFNNQTLTATGVASTTIAHVNGSSNMRVANVSELISYGPSGPRGEGVLLVRGNDSTAWFARDTGVDYITPAGSLSVLTDGGISGTGGYTLTFANGERQYFNSGGRLVTIADTFGRQTQLTYDSEGRILQVTLPAELSGRQLSYVYDANGDLDQLTDFAGRTFQFGWSGGAIGSVLAPDPDGGGKRKAPLLTFAVGNPAFEVTLKTETGSAALERKWLLDDEGGGPFQTLVRPDGSAWRQSSVLGTALQDTVAIAEAVAQTEDLSAPGSNGFRQILRTTSQELDRFGYVTVFTNTHGVTSHSDRNDDGQLSATWVAIDGEAPEVTEYAYTSWGALESITEPGPVQQRWEYPVDSFLASKSIDRNGVATRYEYYGAAGTQPENALKEVQIGRTTTWGNVPHQGTLVTTYTYDSATGNVATITRNPTQGDTTTTSYTYDAKGWLSSVTTPLGTETYVHTADGLQTSHTNSIGAQFTFKYDNDGRQTHKYWPIIDGSKRYFEQTVYDGAGWIAATYTVGNAVPRRTYYQHDDLGRLVRLTQPDPDGSGPLAAPVKRWVYEEDHRREIDANGAVTRYDYWDHDPSRVRLITHPDPDGSGAQKSPTEEFWYDDRGYLEGHRNSRDGFTWWVVNSRGQVERRDRDGDAEHMIYVYDPEGRVTGEYWTAAEQLGGSATITSGTTTVYDDFGNVSSIRNAAGAGTENHHDHTQSPTRKQAIVATGWWAPKATDWFYDSWGRIDYTYDALGQKTTYDYWGTTPELVRTITLPDPDRDGPLPRQQATWYYDVLGRTIQHDGFDGITTDSVFDVFLRLESTTLPDPDGGGSPLTQPKTIYTYDDLDRQIAVADHIGNVTTWEYDAAGRKIREVQPDPDGSGPLASPENIWEYDALGRISREQDPRNAGSSDWYVYTYENSSAFDPANGDYMLTTPEAEETEHEHDSLGRLVLTTVDGSARVRREYNDQGQITRVGNDALTTYEEYTYNKAGLVTEHRDVAGGLTTTTYDAFQRIISVNDHGYVTNTAYDSAGRVDVVSHPDPGGTAETTTYEYDNLSRTVFVTDGRGQFTRTGFDALGRVERSWDKNGSTTEYAFDALNRVTSTTNVYGTTRIQFYDELGNIWHVQDPRDPNPYDQGAWQYRTDTYTFDNLSRLTEEEDPNGGFTNYEYDAAGNRTKVTDPGQATGRNVTTFEYDRVNRVVKETNEVGLVREWGHDAAGNVDYQKDRNGRVTEFTWEFAYDGGSNYRRDTEVWKASDGSTVRTIDWAYDTNGWLSSVSDSDGGGTVLSQLDYSYTANGLVSALGLNLGAGVVVDVTYGYDSRDRLVSAAASTGPASLYTNTWAHNELNQIVEIGQSNTNNGSGVAKRVDLSYTPTGLLDRIQRYEEHSGSDKAAVWSAYTYDDLDRLAEINYFVPDTPAGSGENLAFYQWEYGIDYRIDKFSSARGVDQYGYDLADQLTDIDSGYQSTQDIAYDANGNRTTHDVDGAVDTYTHAAANRLTGDGTWTYQYDNEGNRTRKADASTQIDYSWDHRNRLTTVTWTDVATSTVTRTVTYAYDVNNRRIRKTVADGSGTVTGTEVFVWDRDHVSVKLDATGQATTTNLYGPGTDMLFTSEDALSEVLWALTDNQNTVRDIADYDAPTDSSSVVATREYDILGNLLTVSGTDVTASDKIDAGYTGREWDADADLYYYRARWYDADVSRFISEDPLGFEAGDVNVQRYVGNNLPNAADPAGLKWKWWDEVKLNIGLAIIDLHLGNGVQDSVRAVTEFNAGFAEAFRTGPLRDAEFVRSIPSSVAGIPKQLSELREAAVPAAIFVAGQCTRPASEVMADIESFARIAKALATGHYRGLSNEERAIAEAVVAFRREAQKLFAAELRSLTPRKAGSLAGMMAYEVLRDAAITTTGAGAAGVVAKILKHLDGKKLPGGKAIRKALAEGGPLRKRIDKLSSAIRRRHRGHEGVNTCEVRKQVEQLGGELSNADRDFVNGINGQNGAANVVMSGAAIRTLQPGETAIGFMDKSGKLVGELADPAIGHYRLADLYGISHNDLRKPRYNVIAITVHKTRDGQIRAFGSGDFPPPGGTLAGYLRTLAERLVR